MVKIKRFEKIPYCSNMSFYKKIFRTSETKYCLRYKNSSLHFAGKFAVKEAVKKSIHEKINLLDIETSHSRSKPKVTLKKKLPYRFLVSISHESDVAVAIVISERIR